MKTSRLGTILAVLACLWQVPAVFGAAAGAAAGAAVAPVTGERARDAFAQGGTGFHEAGVRAKASGKPLFLYFYTDWCGYCRQFEQELLSKPEVIAALGDYEPVAINPEKGEAEAALGELYDVDSFPALMVQLPGSEARARLRRTVSDQGAARLMTAPEFVRALSAAAAAARGAG